MARHRERVKASSDVGDDRKRKYNSLNAGEQVSAEDMEAYRLTQIRPDDPLH